MIQREDRDGRTLLRVPDWADRLGMPHAFFGRTGGVSPPPYASLNVGPSSGDAPRNVSENLDRIAATLSYPRGSIFCAAQVHGTEVVGVCETTLHRSAFTAATPIRADALVTEAPKILLGILTADCLPVLFFDPDRPAVAAAHAGWRGTLGEICVKTFDALSRGFGTRADRCRVALGPAIGPCCYVVGPDVAEAFLRARPDHHRFVHPAGPGAWRLDLEGLNRAQLARIGIPPTHVASSGLCTCCHADLFFSVRGQGEPTGRQVAVAGIARP